MAGGRTSCGAGAENAARSGKVKDGASGSSSTIKGQGRVGPDRSTLTWRECADAAARLDATEKAAWENITKRLKETHKTDATRRAEAGPKYGA